MTCLILRAYFKTIYRRMLEVLDWPRFFDNRHESLLPNEIMISSCFRSAVMICLILIGLTGMTACHRNDNYTGRGMHIDVLEKSLPFSASIESIIITGDGPAHPSTNVFIGFRIATGRRFVLGGFDADAADAVLIGFAQSLKVSNHYLMPKTWLDYKKKFVQTGNATNLFK